MRPILVAAIIALAPLPGRVSAQTQQGQPSLSDDEKKPQQNSADEAGVRGRLEDGIKPGKPSDQTEANKKVEDAAADAKNKSDAKTTGCPRSSQSVRLQTTSCPSPPMHSNI